MQFVDILFYFFSSMTVIAALAVIASRNPVYSVLWLIFCFFNCAALFVLLGAELVAMLLVIVYVGAVAVLFLFVVMMLNIKTATLKKGFQSYLPIGLLLAAILMAEMGTVIYASVNKAEKEEISQEKIKDEEDQTATIKVETVEKKRKHKKKHLSVEDKLLHEEAEKSLENSILNAEVSYALKEKEKTREETEAERIPNTDTNANQIGEILYTDYVLMFQTSGLILLVAMIGAIVLTLRHRDGVKRQNIKSQTSRNRKNSLQIVKVETGKGI